MKYLLTPLFFVLGIVQSQAQSVLNVRAFEEDGVVEILYDLYTTKVEKEFYVTLKVSKDGGKVYTPIFETIGDANKNVRTGSDHFIIWNPQQTTSDSLVFKVEAQPKRSIEQQGNPNADKIYTHDAGQIAIVNVLRFNSAVEFTFSLKNLREKDSTFIVATKFYIKDEKNQDYSKVVLSQNDRIGTVVICKPKASTIFKIRVEGIPETIQKFNNVGFTLSEMVVPFLNVKIDQ